MTLRSATPDDAGALAAFGRRVFAATFGPDNDPADLAAYLDASYVEARQLADLTDPAVDTILAEADGAIAGFVQLRAGVAVEGVTGPAPVELWRLYVDARFHGRGLAARLLAAAEAAARRRGAGTLWLGVWERNPRAQAFYRKHGFAVVATQVFQLGSDAQRDLVMQKPLPEATDRSASSL